MLKAEVVLAVEDGGSRERDSSRHGGGGGRRGSGGRGGGVVRGGGLYRTKQKNNVGVSVRWLGPRSSGNGGRQDGESIVNQPPPPVSVFIRIRNVVEVGFGPCSVAFFVAENRKQRSQGSTKIRT